ncbi:acetyl-CoA acetyltransferase [Mesorhizobium qingshengii]|uniref:Acetyl-CoA acetyltransferase n=1 Tax=Mesorhizobium qingshengii TaxID=1165689 RepID=A0ABT4QYB4_9HYPH|nr:acetyl-CoA acetyltransferase [Mesorhizobium qingshengii]MCZ8546499.1 acetyl-CoA acetyltransferase [Mesorhizobium qingshengii]
MRKAQIVGWHHSPFGRSAAPDTEALMAEVAIPALDHAGVSASDVDAIFVGVYNNGFSRQDFQAALVGMGTPELCAVPATRHENACATGSAAVYAALDFVEAGRGRIALIVGAEKMTALPARDIGNILLSGCYRKEEAETEAGFAGVFAQIAKGYFRRYGDRSEELAHIAAKNHRNALDNPYAHMRTDLGFDFCNKVSERNPLVAPPLRRTDCSPVSDGAAALVIADDQTAASLRRAVGFRSRSHANDHMALSRRDPTEFAGARRAWAKALADAKLGLADIDLIETHDCFTIAELIEYEAMGLAEQGQGWRIVREGTAHRSGRLPVNPSGGLKARGHPLGATGVSMHIMAAMQLVGEAGGMQVGGAEIAGVFNMGGAAVTNYASILERVK